MKHYDSVEVGKRIKDIRKKAGIKQIKLAEEMHISNDMLSRIENGKNTCAPDHLMFLCQRFNKTSDYFYFGLENDKYEMMLASGRNDHSESGEINQFQPLENSQCTSATPFLS